MFLPTRHAPRAIRKTRLKRVAAILAVCLGAAAIAAPASVVVKRGDSLWDISKRYGVSIATIKKINNLNSDTIKAGQTLRLATPKAATTAPQVKATTVAYTGNANKPIWPIGGRISDTFGIHSYVRVSGSRMHTGVDIATPTGTPVHAATSGEVAFAGWDNSGYGNLVVINAYDGRSYYYGHNSQLVVKAGQTVAQGQTISLSGSTGASTGPHLHFEIRVNGVAVNPLPSLPGSTVQFATYRPPAGSKDVGGGN